MFWVRDAVRQHVDPQKGYYTIGRGDDGIVFDARPEFQRVGKHRQAGQDLGWNTPGSRHFEVAAACQRLDRGAEGSGGSFARQFNRKDDGHAERHRGDHQRRAPAFTRERPQDEAVENLQVRHYNLFAGSRISCTRPSRRRTTLSAIPAASML